MIWTDARVNRLRHLCATTSLSALDIAVELDMDSRNAVIGKCKRLRIELPRGGSNRPPPPRQVPRSERRAPFRAAPKSPQPSVPKRNSAMVPVADPIEVVPFVVPVSLRVTISDLKEAMCRWPLGDPSSAEFRYCGLSAPGASPYCSGHHQIAYQPNSTLRKANWEKAA